MAGSGVKTYRSRLFIQKEAEKKTACDEWIAGGIFVERRMLFSTKENCCYSDRRDVNHPDTQTREREEIMDEIL